MGLRGKNVTFVSPSVQTDGGTITSVILQTPEKCTPYNFALLLDFMGKNGLEIKSLSSLGDKNSFLSY